MASIDAYRVLCERIEEILGTKNFKISANILNHDNAIQYDFFINQNGNPTVATQLTCYYDEKGEVLEGATRSSYSRIKTLKVFNISSLFTSHEYKGQKLASLLLIYGICYMKCIHSNTNYATLDDDSDNSSKIKKNIYNNLGFVYRHLQSLKSSNELKMTGPEKQLLLGTDFIRRANHILSDILSKGGKYTVKELKNIAIKNKIKITKKIDQKTVSLNKNDLIKKLKNIIT